jgi:hypothetical protein
VASPLTNHERRALSNVVLVAGVLAVVIGTAAFMWAYRHAEAGSLRHWGYGVGALLLIGGTALLFGSALIWPRRDSTDT